MRRFAACALLLAMLAALGCGRGGGDEVGVVAKVNGRPISLSMLEFQYDIQRFEAFAGALPTVGALREAYGDILGSLIAQELVSQELEKRGQHVSDEELREAEAKIRADYPDDTFELMLADEFIDLGMWRKQLKYFVAVEKFQRLVLRPQVHIDYREAEAYYRAHQDEFRQPERLRLIVARAQTRDLVDKALAQYKGQKNLAAVEAAFPGVQLRESTVSRELLPKAWADALEGSHGQGAAVVVGDRYGFEGLLVLEKLPAHTLDPTQAYPQIEAALVERRMLQVFDAWLAKAVDASIIQVSGRILHKQDDEDLPPDVSAVEQENATIASGNETG